MIKKLQGKPLERDNRMGEKKKKTCLSREQRWKSEVAVTPFVVLDENVVSHVSTLL